MLKPKPTNETFRVNIEAFDAIREAAKDATIAELLGISSSSNGKDFKHWTDRDKRALRDAMRPTSLTITFLHSDWVFFVYAAAGSHVVINKNKALLYSEVLGVKADTEDSARVEFRVYSRLINGAWHLLAALYVVTADFEDGKLKILASWPMFAVEDEVFTGLGFEVERPDASAYFTDEFGDDVYVSGVDYLKSGVRYTAL